jgi:hypothetical protein
MDELHRGHNKRRYDLFRPTSHDKRTDWGRRRQRRTVTVVAVAVAAIALGLSVRGLGLSHRPDSSARVASYESYSAVRSHAGSGLLVVPLSRAAAASHLSTRPIWVAVTPHDANAVLPEVYDARELTRRGADRFWVAPSSRGGICLLAFAPQRAADTAHAHSVLATCGTNVDLSEGVALLLTRAKPEGADMVLGLVPDPVRSIVVRFATGSSKRVAVHNNLYLFGTSRHIRTVTFRGAGDRSVTQMKIGGVP